MRRGSSVIACVTALATFTAGSFSSPAARVARAEAPLPPGSAQLDVREQALGWWLGGSGAVSMVAGAFMLAVSNAEGAYYRYLKLALLERKGT